MTALTCPNGHSLRSLEGRFCPECGATLGTALPSSAPTAFCAVHAGVPAVRPCVRCGNFACAQCLLVGDRWEEQCASCRTREAVTTLPWDAREEIGLLKAYWRTSTQLMLKPARTFEHARPDGSVGSSLLYAAMSSICGVLGTGVAYCALAVAVISGLAISDKNPLNIGFGTLGFVALIAGGVLIFTTLAGVGAVVVGAGLDHLVLRMARAQPKPWTTTLRANALSMAPYLLGLIPLCGGYVAVVWTWVLKVFAYRAFHRTTYGKAALGSLLVPGLVFFFFLAGYAAIFAMVGWRGLK